MVGRSARVAPGPAARPGRLAAAVCVALIGLELFDGVDAAGAAS